VNRAYSRPLWFLLLFWLLLVLGATITYVRFVPEVYRATCTILIEPHDAPHIWATLPIARSKLNPAVLISGGQTRSEGIYYKLAIDASQPQEAVDQVHLFAVTWQELAYNEKESHQPTSNSQAITHLSNPIRISALATLPKRPTKLQTTSVIALATVCSFGVSAASYYFCRYASNIQSA
jgi:hypothetical protein